MVLKIHKQKKKPFQERLTSLAARAIFVRPFSPFLIKKVNFDQIATFTHTISSKNEIYHKNFTST